MKGIDIILVFVIAFIMYHIITSSNEKFVDVEDDNLSDNVRDQDEEDVLEALFKYKKSDKTTLINPYFYEAQFHNDYRDTLTAFNNICPRQKQIFNVAHLPVKFTNPNPSEVKHMIKDFIKELNNSIVNEVTDRRVANSGWDEAIPDPQVKSGWDKHMEGLGLLPGVYNQPAPKSKVRIVAIDHVEKYETDDEIRYICFIVLQKKNIDEQIITRLSFVKAKRDVNEERQFFNKDSKHQINRVILEEIYIIGFLSEQGMENAKSQDDFYNFSALHKGDMIDRQEIVNELVKKYKQKNHEMRNLTANLDEEGRAFHSSLPKYDSYNSYQVTQTIFDDWNNNNHYE